MRHFHGERSRMRAGPGPTRFAAYPEARRGLAHMLLASVLFAVMGAAVYAASLSRPPVDAAVASFLRVAVNLLILALPALASREWPALIGDRRPSLWLRGLFGGLSLMLSFAAITRIGPGESALLLASSAVFVAALGPWALGQRNSPWVWLAILGALTGLFLLFQPRPGQADSLGRAMGLGAGFCAALAYLMVARAGRSNPPRTVVFYFCLVGVLLHLVWFGWRGVRLPEGAAAWGLVLFAGLAGSAAQIHMTRAYQLAPAALVGAVGYVAPALGVVFGALLFARMPDRAGWIGCALVLSCGVVLPFLATRAGAPKAVIPARRGSRLQCTRAATTQNPCSPS